MNRIARRARGRRPQYFSDPATDRLMSIVLTLASELSVTRERLDALERLLGEARVLPPGCVDDFVPDEETGKERSAARRAFVERLLHAVSVDQPADGGPVPDEAEIFRLLDPEAPR